MVASSSANTDQVLDVVYHLDQRHAGFDNRLSMIEQHLNRVVWIIRCPDYDYTATDCHSLQGIQYPSPWDTADPGPYVASIPYGHPAEFRRRYKEFSGKSTPAAETLPSQMYMLSYSILLVPRFCLPAREPKQDGSLLTHATDFLQSASQLLASGILDGHKGSWGVFHQPQR